MVNSATVIGSLTLEQQSKEYLSHLFIRRLWAELGHGKRIRRSAKLLDFVVVREAKVDFHSMDSNRIDLHATLRTPHKPCIYASNVRIGRVIKRVVRQAHGLIEKGFVVHGRIIGGSLRRWHSYFPWWIAMPASSLFFAVRGQSNAVK